MSGFSHGFQTSFTPTLQTTLQTSARRGEKRRDREHQRSLIREKFERNVKALTLRPAVGQGTAVTRIRLRDGLSCEVEEGHWKLTSGMSEKTGGDDNGPNPGILGRATLGTCLATSYAMWAAWRGVPLSMLEVEIQADYDTRGMYGIDDVPPGYEEIRYVVKVESPAPEDEVLKLLDEADSHCDFLAVFCLPQTVRREVRINGKE